MRLRVLKKRPESPDVGFLLVVLAHWQCMHQQKHRWSAEAKIRYNSMQEQQQPEPESLTAEEEASVPVLEDE